MLTASHLKSLQAISRDAGKAILEIYERDDLQVQYKGDKSPLTAADLAAHTLIDTRLAALTPDIPRLSEEAADISFAQRQQWQRYWCIDPLDGTKEFINRNGEFTVNIALIEQGKPVFGIIYVPVSDALYWNDGHQAWKQTAQAPPQRIRCRPLGRQLRLIASRRHGQEKNAALLGPLASQFDAIDTVNKGSSVKMCLIAEGKADLYPRLFPTSEWDTAASQAIIEAAGGRLVNAHTLQPLRYNQRDSLENPWFIVAGDPAFPLDQLQIR